MLYMVIERFKPEAAIELYRRAVERAAEAVLKARGKYTNASLSELYEPIATPGELVAAHAALDRAVDRAYGVKTNITEMARLSHLFGLYRIAAGEFNSTTPRLPMVAKRRKRG